jgi:hypothetical protein
MGDWRERYAEVVETPEQCVAFVDAVGVCAWLSPLGCGFPNLAETMSIPSNTVINETWFWKDDLHIEKRLFYGKFLGGQAAFASREYLPTLIAAQGDVDPHNLHEQGLYCERSYSVSTFVGADPRVCPFFRKNPLSFGQHLFRRGRTHGFAPTHAKTQFMTA